MKAKYLFIASLAAMVITGCAKTTPKGNADYKTMYLSDFPYQSFVKNWDDSIEPVRSALIKNAAEFENYFGSAATMDNKKPFTPTDEDFSNYQYVLVSQVTTPPEKDFSFTVDSVVYNDSHLDVYYTYTKPSKDAGYQIKDGFLLQIPNVEVKSITVYENKQKVAEVK